MNRKTRHIAKVTRHELTEFVQSNNYFDTDWGCSCLVCSWLLEKVFKAHGIDCELCIGEWDGNGHAFVMIGDTVVDITATQFKLPALHIERLDDSYYKVNFSGRNARLDMKNWPSEQSPRRYKRQLATIFRRIMQRTI